MQWIVSLSPILTLLINLLVNIICMHLTHRKAFSILAGLMSGLISELIFFTILFGNGNAKIFIEAICSSLLTYLALSFCYWAFLNLNFTSLRIRLARELLKENNNSLSTENILQQYSPQELVSRRLKRLEFTAQIKQQDNKWVLSSKKLLLLLIVIRILRKLIIPPNSKAYSFKKN